MEILLPLLAIFYLVGIPVWLLSLNGKVRELEERLQSEGAKPQQKPTKPPAFTPQPTQQPAKQVANTLTSEKKAAAKPKPQRSFEEQVGGHVFQWLGIGALIIALSVFLKWSFENGLIGETGRVVMGYLIAAVGLAAGELLRKKYDTWSLAFTGGGALAAYIVTWIAMNWYQMFPPSIGFIIFIATAAIVCLLAMRYDAIALAGFGIVGGFLTPVLAGSDGTMLSLLLYIAVLDVAILALGHVRNWRVLNVLAFCGTAIYEIYAFVGDGTLPLVTCLVFIGGFTLLYLLIPAVYNILKKQASSSEDIFMLLGNGALHFGLTLMCLQNVSTQLRTSYDVVVALVFATLYLLWSMAVYKKNKNDTPLVLGSLSFTIMFASIAIPMQLGIAWTSIAWSIEAVFLIWLSLTLKDTRIQWFAWPVMALAYFWYFFSPRGTGAIQTQTGFWIFLLWVAMFVGIAYAGLNTVKQDRKESHLLPFTLVGAIILTLALLMGIDISHTSTLERLAQTAALVGGSYAVLLQAGKKWADLTPQERQCFTWLGVATQIVTLSYLTYEFIEAINDGRLFANSSQKDQITQVGISILWAVYGSATLVAGMARGWTSIRLFSLILLLVAIGKLALIDFAYLGTAARVIGFTVLGGLLVIASFIYQHHKDRLTSFFTDSSTK